MVEQWRTVKSNDLGDSSSRATDCDPSQGREGHLKAGRAKHKCADLLEFNPFRRLVIDSSEENHVQLLTLRPP